MAELLALMRKFTMAAPAAGPPKKKRRKRKKPNSGLMAMSSQGQISLARRELLGTVSLGKSSASATGHFDLIPDTLAFLKGVFKNFDRVKWLKLNVYYKPAVGTTYGGMVAVGMDWDFKSEDVGRSKISAFTPSQTFAAWADTESKALVLPRDKLMSRTWYIPASESWSDKGPGKLHWAAEGTADSGGKTLGEFWIDYSVVMDGTNPL